MLRPLLAPLLSNPLRAPMVLPRLMWTPKLLFPAGVQGFWYDPTDLSSQFQDSAGTTPVTAAGQPVGKILDKSGRGNHLVQATAASRPTLQQDGSGFWHWLFDGVDDFLPSTCPTTSVGVLILGCSVGALGFSTPVASGGQAAAEAGVGIKIRDTGALWTAAANGTVAAQAKTAAGLISAGAPVVLRNAWSTTTLQAAVNGAGAASVATGFDAATANVFHIGKANSGTTPEFFPGRIYGLIGRGAATDAATIARVERFVGARMGIAL